LPSHEEWLNSEVQVFWAKNNYLETYPKRKSDDGSNNNRCDIILQRVPRTIGRRPRTPHVARGQPRRQSFTNSREFSRSSTSLFFKNSSRFLRNVARNCFFCFVFSPFYKFQFLCSRRPRNRRSSARRRAPRLATRRKCVKFSDSSGWCWVS